MTVSGKGTFIKGTGRFEGIQGEMIFSGRYLTPYSKEKGLYGDMLIDATSNYKIVR